MNREQEWDNASIARSSALQWDDERKGGSMRGCAVAVVCIGTWESIGAVLTVCHFLGVASTRQAGSLTWADSEGLGTSGALGPSTH